MGGHGPGAEAAVPGPRRGGASEVRRGHGLLPTGNLQPLLRRGPAHRLLTLNTVTFFPHLRHFHPDHPAAAAAAVPHHLRRLLQPPPVIVRAWSESDQPGGRYKANMNSLFLPFKCLPYFSQII